MPTVSCKQCGNEFHIKPSKLKSGRGKFCSRVCYAEWRKDNWVGENSPAWRGGIASIERECEICGEIFVTSQRNLDRGFGRFCSQRCASKWRSVAFRGSGGSNWQGGKKVVRTCEVCGAEYETWHDRNRRFCSIVCMGKWQSVNKCGENNNCWRGGVSFEPYPPEFNNEFKRMIRKRDERRCAICRFPARCVHHINYVKDDTNPENCITLCRRCHGATNHNRDYWQPTLSHLLFCRLTTN